MREIHPSVEKVADRRSHVNPLANLLKSDGKPFGRVDKVAIALAVCSERSNVDILDLSPRLTELVSFIRDSAREPAVSIPVVPEVLDPVE